MARSPFVINTRDLGRRPGSMRREERNVDTAESMGSEVIAVTPGTEVHLDLRLEAVMEGVLVTGAATTTAVGECVRCLRPLQQDLEVDITELFAYPGARRHQPDEDDQSEPLPVLDGDLLDLEGTLTDAIVLTLPFQPLCRPDCGGLCSVCGVRLDDAEEGHSHELLDPRWAALGALAALTETEDDDGDGDGEEGDDDVNDGEGDVRDEPDVRDASDFSNASESGEYR